MVKLEAREGYLVCEEEGSLTAPVWTALCLHTRSLASWVPTQRLNNGANQTEAGLCPDGRRCGGKLCWLREEGFELNEGKLVGNQATVLRRRDRRSQFPLDKWVCLNRTTGRRARFRKTGRVRWRGRVRQGGTLSAAGVERKGPWNRPFHSSP